MKIRSVRGIAAEMEFQTDGKIGGRKMFIVVNIGCIECGVSSNVVGVFADEARAVAVADALSEKNGWREGGQNSYEVFPMPEAESIADEYRDFISEGTE